MHILYRTFGQLGGDLVCFNLSLPQAVMLSGCMQNVSVLFFFQSSFGLTVAIKAEHSGLLPFTCPMLDSIT